MTPSAETPEKSPGPIVLVTGMSGAGRTSALRIFEDMGYEAVDNLPLSLLDTLVSGGGGTRSLAIGVDIRTRDFAVEAFLDQLGRLRRESSSDVRIIFLDCDDDVLVRRYTETRRRHPLADDRPVPDGIKLERRLLERLRDSADVVIDTTDTTPWTLKRHLVERFAPEEAPGLGVSVTSFSFRRGVPREADLVFDVRFLRNPHYEKDLRPLTGQDAEIAAYVSADSDFEAFFRSLTDMLDLLLPRFESEGKSYLTIAIGCTGGRHRSVFVAERLVDWLARRQWRAQVYHRDLAGGGGREMI